MDPVQAFAILSLGAFLTVLVTAIFYIFTVRPRLLEPVPLESMGLLDESLREELAEQRTVVERLNTALVHHTEQLESGTGLGQGFDGLRGMLQSQSETVKALRTLLNEQTGRLEGLDNRLSRQETALSTLTADSGRLDALRSTLEARLGEAQTGAGRELAVLVQDQAQKLVSISARLDEWAATGAQGDNTLAAHARTLAELDRQMAAHAQVLQRLDARVSEHTTMLITADAERREQAGVLDRIMQRIGELFPLINQIIVSPPRPDADRLTDVKGIGPVYAGKLYEAGIHTFKQLATMTQDELQALIGEPKWRRKNIDTASWIEQAQLFASQREKLEHLP
ncbi:MAG: hypothetical protein JXJ20_03090 [Anaerolineae bacterium]|nr:hypothetical protein [Anaerolineae bacterium]